MHEVALGILFAVYSFYLISPLFFPLFVNRFGLHFARLHQETGRSFCLSLADALRSIVPEPVGAPLRVVEHKARTRPHGPHRGNQFRVDNF